MDITLSLKKQFTLALTACLPCLLSPLSGLGATANVSVVNDSFSPKTTSINAGDTVIWTWGTGAANHNVVSTTTPFAWLFPNTGGTTANQNDSNLKSASFAFTNTFSSAGSYPYECTEHVNFGMTGTITVAAAANQPPTVTITNPVSGAVFTAPVNLNIQASASDSDGTVTNVQFLIGSTVLTNNTSSPFFAVTNNLPAGNFTLTAIASDNDGATATNAVTISVVTPTTVSLAHSAKSSSTNFQFSYPANVGLSYVIQRSTNLTAPNWISILTNVAASNPVVFTDTHATNTPGYYRVGRLPNP